MAVKKGVLQETQNASGPPPTGVTRAWYKENLAAQQTTSTGWTSHEAFTVGDRRPNKRQLVIASGILSSALDTNDMLARFVVGGVVKGECSLRARLSNDVDRRSFVFATVLPADAAPADVACVVQFATGVAGQAVDCSQVRFEAWEIDDAAVFQETDAEQSRLLSSTMTSAIDVSLGAGAWIILAFGCFRVDNISNTIKNRLVDDAGAQDAYESYLKPAAATDFIPRMLMWPRIAGEADGELAATRTVTLQFAPNDSGANGYVKHAKVLAIPASFFTAVHVAHIDTSVDSGAPTTPTNVGGESNLEITLASGRFSVLASVIFEGSNTTSSYYVQMTDADHGTPPLQSNAEPQSSSNNRGNIPAGIAYAKQRASGAAAELHLQRHHPGGQVTKVKASSFVAVLGIPT